MAYSKKTWVDGEVITKEAMNNIENGVATADAGIPVNATKAKAGLVKQATLVPEAVGTNVTKEEFKALLDALKASGQMASS
ncbi:hypothetical protein HMPREF1216_00483 [Coprococcus sp. HPP0048]|nr:hypothetical protein HMPREF1216_00483 [Coprococcus sp. HPP0048]